MKIHNSTPGYQIKKSIRIGQDRVSSFNIPKSVLALYGAVLCDRGDPMLFAFDAVDRITDELKPTSAKGITPIVVERLMYEIAYENDMKTEYLQVLGEL